MKQLILILTFLGIASVVSAQTIDNESIDFVNKFYKAVVAHKSTKVIKCMDKAYRTSQIAFLNGNKEQFVNEIFSGYDIETNEFVNVKLNDIENIEIQEALEPDQDEAGDTNWIYVFHVKTKDHLVKVSLDLKKTGKKLGFAGAVG